MDWYYNITVSQSDGHLTRKAPHTPLFSRPLGRNFPLFPSRTPPPHRHEDESSNQRHDAQWHRSPHNPCDGARHTSLLLRPHLPLQPINFAKVHLAPAGTAPPLHRGDGSRLHLPLKLGPSQQLPLPTKQRKRRQRSLRPVPKHEPHAEIVPQQRTASGAKQLNVIVDADSGRRKNSALAAVRSASPANPRNVS